MSKHIKALNKFLKENGHEEDIEAFSIVHFYMKEYFHTPDELSDEAKILQDLLKDVMKEWNNG